ncbi:hypothetical protein [Streptomyces bluensis]|uniref:hypothetical protein n=1 Tax=Streptomyces bluensis TaxID=33897 RepID=UPI00331AA189
MPEYTPGYVAALAAALMQANTAALYAAEHGNNPLGRPVQGNPGLRIWNGDLLRLGHLPLTPFAVEANVLLQDGLYVDLAHHEHVHIDPELDQWVFCAAHADGAVPITIAVTQTRIDEDPAHHCNHSFPVTPPRGSIDQPGNCRNCGTTYTEARMAATHDEQAPEPQ